MTGTLYKKYWREGTPWMWLASASLAFILLMAATLLVVVVANGLSVFWPARLVQVELRDGSKVAGELVRTEMIPGSAKERIQLKIGNRDLYSLDFRWISLDEVKTQDYPEDIIVLERMEYGNFHGFLKDLRLPSFSGDLPADLYARFTASLAQLDGDKTKMKRFTDRLYDLNSRLATLRNRLATLRYQKVPDSDPRVSGLLAEQAGIQQQFQVTQAEINETTRNLRANVAVFADAGGREKTIPLADIVRSYRPNRMPVVAKVRHYLVKVVELLTEAPRESNTEGGLFPAIFGTVMMVFIMSIFSFPFGVIAGVYLREYAKEGILVRLVRIAVNNLAGIPSIVYGIFGLGFFIYGLGGAIDQVFFPERLPTPTFGTGGILWASLTLGLLTVPVVIVATEEALGAIPQGIREGSLALGATRFQTLLRILLPMASPGILTGFILAMARAAGEVAPLMITGVVKLAPAMPVDGVYPYFHLDRKFMHLGFHIYDIGFQSPNVEAAKPMVFVTTFLLVLIVVCMSSAAIALRNRMKKRYALTEV